MTRHLIFYDIILRFWHGPDGFPDHGVHDVLLYPWYDTSLHVLVTYAGADCWKGNSYHPINNQDKCVEGIIYIRVSEPEPAIKIDGSETLRHPVDNIDRVNESIYFFDHSRNITKKFGPLFMKLLYFKLWEPAIKINGSKTLIYLQSTEMGKKYLRFHRVHIQKYEDRI